MAKEVFYQDELNDDFAGTKINTKKIPEGFKYIHTSFIWRIITWFLYYFIATPIVFIATIFTLGHSFKNRKVLKQAKKSGYFIYSNHTQIIIDTFKGFVAAFPKRGYIIANPDAISIKGLRTLVMMLGCIPVPNSLESSKDFLEAINYRINKEHRVIIIYPEAHIWPYYNKIRNFSSVSFNYPVNTNVPVFAFTTVYTKRKFFKRPKATTYIDGPFYPDNNKSSREAQNKLRDDIYGAMNKCLEEHPSYEYIKYTKK